MAGIAPLPARIRSPKEALSPGMPPMDAGKVAACLDCSDKIRGVTRDLPDDKDHKP